MAPAGSDVSLATTLDSNVNLAYIILAHKLPEQLVRLVRRLDSENATFFIHIDSNAARRDYSVARHGLAGLGNVHFLDRTVSSWATFGHVRATIMGIREVLARGIPFDFAVLLTGQDYPLKSNSDIERTLASGNGRSFLRHYPLPHEHWPGGGMPRIERFHLQLGRRHVALPLKRRFPAGLEPHGGVAYWCLTRECVAYVDQFVAQRPDVVRFFQHTRSSSETFFQTVLCNSPFRDELINDSLRYVDWRGGRANPEILTTEEFEAFMDSSKLFARKFDVTIDAAVLDQIDRHIARSEQLQSMDATST